MIHDCAITQARNGPANAGAPGGGGYVVVLDFALTIRPVRMLRNDFPVEYEPSAGARIGLVPRQGSGAEAAAMGEPIWAEVDPCVVLHTMNAYERADGTVAITALRSEPRTPQSFIESYTTALLHEWVIDPTDGGRCVGERCLSDVPLEFPTIDPRLVGSECKFGFCITPRTIGGPNRYGPPFEGILIDGVAKVDLQSGGLAAQWTAPEGWWVVSEATFVPKLGSAAGLGDEGYLLVFTSQAREVAEGTAEAEDGRASRLYVLDGAALGDEARQRLRCWSCRRRSRTAYTALRPYEEPAHMTVIRDRTPEVPRRMQAPDAWRGVDGMQLGLAGPRRPNVRNEKKA